MLHELYEIIVESLAEMHTHDALDRSVCPQADRFAAAALMQPDIFVPYAQASGLDVAVLQTNSAVPTLRQPCGWPRWCGTNP